MESPCPTDKKLTESSRSSTLIGSFANENQIKNKTERETMIRYINLNNVTVDLDIGLLKKNITRALGAFDKRLLVM